MVEGINLAIQAPKGAEGGQINISIPAHILDRVKVIVNGGNRGHYDGSILCHGKLDIRTTSTERGSFYQCCEENR